MDSDSSALEDIQIFDPLSHRETLLGRLRSHFGSLLRFRREGFFDGGFELLLEMLCRGRFDSVPPTCPNEISKSRYGGRRRTCLAFVLNLQLLHQRLAHPCDQTQQLPVQMARLSKG
jgi:hypothetical protein